MPYAFLYKQSITLIAVALLCLLTFAGELGCRLGAGGLKHTIS